MGDALNLAGLGTYARRVGERWPLERVLVAGARVEDSQGAPPQRERGAEFVIVFVSQGFDGVPWLERVTQAGNLWDGLEMGARADVHCYTPAEFERKRASLHAVSLAAEGGIDLLG